MSVIHSVHRGEGVCLSACWNTTPPGPATPLWTSHTPPDQPHTPDQAHHPPPQTRHTTPSPRTRHTPLGPGTHPRTSHTTPLDQAQSPPPPPRPGTTPPQTRHTHPPPREADSSVRSTSGRYASYWNAFLLSLSSLLLIDIGEHRRSIHHPMSVLLLLLSSLLGLLMFSFENAWKYSPEGIDCLWYPSRKILSCDNVQ